MVSSQPKSAAQLARKYRVTPRTVFKWKAQGVDVLNPLSIAEHVIDNGRPSLPTIYAVIRNVRKIKQPNN